MRHTNQLIICYAGASYPSAKSITSKITDIPVKLVRSGKGHINWGRTNSNCELNPNISTVTDKLRMRKLFQSHGVPAPKLYLSPPSDLSLYPLVARTRKHHRKQGFRLVNDPLEANFAISKGAVQFLEFINAPREYRVHIFNGRSIRLSEKVPSKINPGEFYTTPARHNVKHVREAARLAVEATGLDFGAVDVLANNNQCWVLEVNSAPGVGGTLDQVYAQAFTNWFNSTSVN